MKRDNTRNVESSLSSFEVTVIVLCLFPVHFSQQNSKTGKTRDGGGGTVVVVGWRIESANVAFYRGNPVHARHTHRGIPGGYVTSRNRVHSWRTNRCAIFARSGTRASIDQKFKRHPGHGSREKPFIHLL